MNYPEINLTNCDTEPIHILGKIQSNTCLVAAEISSLRILYVTDNLPELLGIEHLSMLDKPLSAFLGRLGQADQGESLLQVIRFGLVHQFENVNPIALLIHGVPHNLVIHVSGDCVVLELEPSSSDVNAHLQTLVGSSLSRILEGKTLDDILQSAATQIRELIGYDRVMVYKFWEDGHGEVVAETRRDDLEPFMGLHYPASDIPKQARELYKINLIRGIADVTSTPADIVSFTAVTKDRPLDLTHAIGRAVSSIHVQYLRNMGVDASFSVSLVADDELWGLIACHNYSPRFIDYKARQHAKVIGQVLSSSIQYRNNQEDKEVNLSFRNAADEIVRKMHQDWSLIDALSDGRRSVLDITHATGAAISFERTTTLLGVTPTADQVEAMLEWVRRQVKPQVFYTHQLGQLYKPAAQFRHKASGLLVISISRELGEYILLFKPELVTTVKWAGNPEKPVEIDQDGVSSLSPRRSFAVWSDEVRGMSEKWGKAELNSINKFREDLVHFINLKANEIRRLNERLKEAYDELDTFSYTISHDLKTPIASVKNYAEILLEDNPDLNEQSRHFIGRILKGADKMNMLIKDVMSYSRVSRGELHRESLDMKGMLEEISAELISAYQPANLQFSIEGTPAIKGDRTMISQVFSNLISNAIKYSAKSDPSVVRVEGKTEEGQVIYSIADNGIGIDMNFGGHIFELFKRMDNAKSFEGTGVGLAIVKRIMEKHNAKIWFESLPQNGTKFYLSFQLD